MKPLIALALFSAAFVGCNTTTTSPSSDLPRFGIPQDARSILVVDRHQFGYDLWYSSSREEQSQCGYELSQRPIRLRLANLIEARSPDIGIEFASVFASQLPEELMDVQIKYHGSPLTRGIIQDLPLAEPKPLAPYAAQELARDANADLVLSIDWIILQESLIEEVAGSETAKGGTSVTYELRSIKSAKAQASCGFRLYDGKSGALIDQATFTYTKKNKYREPINCETLLATLSHESISNCFKQLIHSFEYTAMP